MKTSYVNMFIISKPQAPVYLLIRQVTRGRQVTYILCIVSIICRPKLVSETSPYTFTESPIVKESNKNIVT